MAITNYGKMAFEDNDGSLLLVQPKSFTKANEGEARELLDLIMKGKYVLVQMAIPVTTYNMENKNVPTT